MKPIPSTLETRRRAAIERCAQGVRSPEPFWHPSVLPRLQCVVDLGPDATAEQIIAAQTALDGRPTDLQPTERCSGCDAQVERIVTVGEEPDYESATAHLCRACLVEALAALDGAP